MVLYRFFFFLVLLFCLCCQPTQRSSQQTLVASQNLLSDRILFLLGEKAMQQTVLISALANSQRYSTVAGLWPKSVPSSDFLGESILRSKANIVFVTPYSNPNVVALLASSNIKVITLPHLTGFDSFSQAVRIIANTVNLEDEGAQLIKRFEKSLKNYKRPKSGVSVISYADGLTAGNNTFWDDSLTLTGFINVAKERGIVEYQPVTMEQLLRWSPDIIVISCDNHCEQTKERFQNLPEIKKLFKGKVRAVPSRLLSVADDTVIELLKELHSW